MVISYHSCCKIASSMQLGRTQRMLLMKHDQIFQTRIFSINDCMNALESKSSKKRLKLLLRLPQFLDKRFSLATKLFMKKRAAMPMHHEDLPKCSLDGALCKVISFSPHQKVSILMKACSGFYPKPSYKVEYYRLVQQKFQLPSWIKTFNDHAGSILTSLLVLRGLLWFKTLLTVLYVSVFLANSRTAL